MTLAVLKSLSTVNGDDFFYPDDIENCEIELVAEIGPENDGSNYFNVIVVTAKFLGSKSPIWLAQKKGYLVLDVFDWASVESSINKLLSHQPKGSWDDIASFLSEYLNWEFDGYQKA